MSKFNDVRKLKNKIKFSEILIENHKRSISRSQSYLREEQNTHKQLLKKLGELESNK